MMIGFFFHSNCKGVICNYYDNKTYKFRHVFELFIIEELLDVPSFFYV